MTNFIFKSPKRLLKNSSITLETLDRKIYLILKEQIHSRSDNKDIKLMLEKLLIDKHLQMQVDTYFDETSPQTDSDELVTSD